MVEALENQIHVPNSPSYPCPILHLIVHYFAPGKETTKDIERGNRFSRAMFQRMKFTLYLAKTWAEVQEPHTHADVQRSFPYIIETCWGPPANKN